MYYRDTSLTLWEPFNNGLPNVIVNELEIQYQTNELILATYGRGVWKLVYQLHHHQSLISQQMTQAFAIFLLK